MLSEELLQVPQMYYAIKRERVMVRIIEYGMSDVGQKQMRELLYGVGNQVLSHMDIEPMRKEINKAVYKGYQLEGHTSRYSIRSLHAGTPYG